MLTDERLEHLREIADLPDLSGTRYRLIRRLGRGGMATVYLVEDESLARQAALKVLSDPDPSGTLATRLLAEARLLARLEHPNLAPVHDVGTLPDGRVFYVMKFVRGERLDVWRRSGPARPAMLRLYQKICDAVAFAHAQSVIHRDLKPENIMIGSFGEALVMDWGVAKELSAATEQPTLALTGPPETTTGRPATAAGTIIGTPAWMAPEQARGETGRIDARTDVHGLGAILYYLLAGRPPFEGAPEEVLRLAAEGEPRPLRQADPTVAKPLAAICSRAMARDPEDRYATVTALSRDVERFLDGGPVEAYPETIWERAARFLGRNKTLVFIILAYLLMRLLVLFFAGR